MFTHILLDTEKDAFIQLLLYLARIDGQVSTEEITAIQPQADMTYTEAEHQGIQQIANQLGVSEKKIIEIEKWVQEGVVWMDNGVKIISEGE